ncbi:MAG: carboxypeptidase regulatory-like domain-containing protein [Verrucomicrobia bacterium]|nr:carboxypeptidase regulatory-like domain-containing protein [Verrucomicrobiota bacterium]
MRGGETRKSLVVRVGNPSTFRIKGHVVDAKNRPLEGMKVFVDDAHFGVSDSDGSYAILNLPAGSYTVDAIEPVSGSLSFARPYFDNPVVVGPDREAIDLVGIPGLLLTKTALIAKKAAAWRYLDTGVDQGTTWANPSFNDSGWKTGAAVLGYGQGTGLGAESTVINFGPDPNNKYTTAYFRKSFVVANPLIYTNYLMEVLRDDGVVVYLNGKEIYRNNMPPTGVITYATRAVDTVEPDSFLSQTIANTEVQPGVNWIAAEVHQATANSSDLTFDFAFTGIGLSNAVGLNLVYFQKPTDQSRYTNGQPVAMTASVFSATPVTRVDFYADGGKLGESSSSPFQFVWPDPAAGNHVLRCVGVLGGIQVTSPAVSIIIAPPLPDLPTVDLLAAGGSWRYLSKSSAAPSTWSQPSFDDSSWTNGVAKLGFGHADEATVINGGPSNARFTTVYFRSQFVVADPAGLTNLVAQLKRDDGAVVYINGVEVLRDNIGPGAVSYATLATNAADNGSVFYAEALDVKALNALLPGTNVVAVEVHQSSANSSDLAFDFALAGPARLQRERGCYLVAPDSGASFPADSPLVVRADAVAGGALGVQRVGFFVDGQKLGEDTAIPYTFTWAHPNSGPHSLKAVAIDAQGDSMESAVVSITITPPSSGTQWISFGDFWKYLDDGSDQGSNWVKRSFNDLAWRSGPARLGYGLGSQIETALSTGTNSALRNITAYFRKAFVVDNPAAFSGIRLLLGRNDGAAVYLNGVEVLRDNLPVSRLSYNTLALSKISGPGDSPPLRALLSNQLLVPGTNVVAVELHQQSATSSDASFDLALSGLTPAPSGISIYLVNPGAGQRFSAPASVGFSAEVLGDGSLPDKVQYYADAALIGESAAYPYSFTWLNAPTGAHSVTARALVAGETVESPAVAITVGPPPPPIAPVLDRLVALGVPWRYWDAVAAVAAGWKNRIFDDSAWKSGPGRLGFGLDGEATTVSGGRMTYYFRRSFRVDKPSQYSQLVFQLARDDGAVVYLNGQEVYRSNMPDGLIKPDTAAVNVVNTPEESIYYETIVPIAGSALTQGTNVVAVEVHQQTLASSDLAFDLQVLGVGTTERRVAVLSPALSGYFEAGIGVEMEAAAQSGSGASVDHVDFYADGQLVGSAASAPWTAEWEDASAGAHQLIARAWFSDETSMDSPPLRVVVSPFRVATQLIAPDGVWRYNDKGLNLGTAWRAASYDDSLWSSGPARLGYGDDGETTVVGYGGNVNVKYITTYFRNSFLLSNEMVVTNLAFRYQRDDGLAVYFNGKEMFRNNLAANPAYTTLAIADVTAADEQTWYTTNITITSYVLGTNVLAAELHQSRANSTDLGFAMEVVGNGYLKTAPVLHPRLEIHVLADGSVEFAWPSGAAGVKLYSAPNIDLPLSAWQPVAESAALLDGKLRVRVENSGDSAFFRLFGK